MYSYNFLKQLSECSRWGSVLRVFLRWRRITARTDATRSHQACCSNTSFQGRRCRDPRWRHIHIMMHSSDHFSPAVRVSQWLLMRWRQTGTRQQKTLPRSASSPSACRASSVRMGETTRLIHR